MVVRGKRGFTPRTFFRASSVPSEMSPKDTWTSEQLHASNHKQARSLACCPMSLTPGGSGMEA